jgi:CRP-like cAMP-binding protein
MNRPVAPSFRTNRTVQTKSCPCTRPCNGANVNSALMQHGESFRFERGDRLWGQDDPADSVVAVCTGALKTVREWPGDKSMIMDITFRGGITGAEAAVPDMRRTSTCIALTSGRAMRIGIGTLRRIAREDPNALRALLGALARAQSGFAARLDETQRGPVEERLARVLLRIGDEVGLRDSRGTFIPVALSRGDLADLVGCRVETTIRIMTRWQRQGVVETQREGLVLVDSDALREVAHSG